MLKPVRASGIARTMAKSIGSIEPAGSPASRAMSKIFSIIAIFAAAANTVTSSRSTLSLGVFTMTRSKTASILKKVKCSSKLKSSELRTSSILILGKVNNLMTASPAGSPMLTGSRIRPVCLRISSKPNLSMSKFLMELFTIQPSGKGT